MVEQHKVPYELIGKDKLHMLVDSFYQHVSNDSELYQLFPTDLTEVRRKQKQFLTQFLGGPSLYSEEHGHPMLRARHLPFTITPDHAKRWLACMIKAMDDVNLQGGVREQMFARLTLTAQHMVNTPNKNTGERID